MDGRAAAEELFDFSLAHADQVSIAATGANSIALSAETPRLTGRATDFVIAAEIAQALLGGRMSRTERVPLEELQRLAFAAHSTGIATLASHSTHQAGSVALSALLPFSPGEHDSTLRDWFLLRLGRAAIDAACDRLNLAREAAPLPLVGAMLLFTTRSEFHEANPPPRATAADECWRLAEQLRSDWDALASERHVALTNALGPRQRLVFDRNAGPRATAQSLLSALEKAAHENSLHPSSFAPLAHEETLQSLAFLKEGATFSAAIFLSGELPKEIWLRSLNNGAHLQLTRLLTSDPTFADRARPRPERTALDPAQRAELVEEWKRQAKEPVPADTSALGCAASIVCALALYLVYRFASGTAFARPVEIALAVMALAGFLYAQAGGSAGRNVMRERIEQGVKALEGTDPAARRAGAVAILLNAYDTSRGPSMSTVIEVKEVRAQLGPSLEFVVEIEEALREELRIYRVFT